MRTHHNMFSRIISFCLCICIVFLLLGESVIATANGSEEVNERESDGGSQGVSHGVTVSFAPPEGQETVKVGYPGIMALSATVSSANSGDASIKIYLPAGVEQYMTQFTEKNGYKIEAGIQTAQGEIKNAVIYLLMDQDRPYLSFSLEQGETLNTQIRFDLPKGFTQGMTIPVKDTGEDKDIIVTTTIDPVEIRGGVLTFTADFDWEGVTKTESKQENSKVAVVKQKTGSVNEDDLPLILARDLVYTIGANSKNGGLGTIFTKKATLTDKLTLPQYVTFVKSGELTVDTSNDSTWLLKSNDGTVVATIAPSKLEGISQGVEISRRISSASISSDKKTLEFVYEQTADYSEAIENIDPENIGTNNICEMPNPNLTVTLAKEQLYVEKEVLDGTYAIKNHVDFSAEPWVTDKMVTSFKDTTTTIVAPEEDFTVKKFSSVSKEDGRMVLTYRIEVHEETGVIGLSGVTIRDTLPDEVELAETGSSEYTVKTENGKTVLYWENQTIPAGGTLTKTVKVKVKSSVAPNTEIINKAEASVEGGEWKSCSVTDTAISPAANITIKKTNNKGNSASVYEDDTITYTVRIENSGLDSVKITPTDQLPAQIVDPRAYQYSDDGKTWVDYASGSVTYNATSHTLTFPAYTLDNDPSTSYRPTIYLRFTGTVQGTADMGTNKQIINTAIANSELGNKESSSIVLVRERLPKLLLNKESGTPLENPSREDLYSIPYTLTIRNEGDETKDVDNVRITDIMSGGLMPKPDPGDSGTITGKWKLGDNEEDIVGTYVRQGTSYYITWNIPSMPGGTTSTPTTASITYEGSIYVPANSSGTVSSISASNLAKLEWKGGSGGTYSKTTNFKPDPSMSKYIYSINGETQADGMRSAPIYVGDTIVYRLMVKNTGNAATVAVVTDDLPEPYTSHNNDSEFQWKLGENVIITNSQFGQATMAEGSNRICWENVRIPAGGTLYADVKLVFPGIETGEAGVKQFISAFTLSSSVRNLSNTMTMTAPDPANLKQLKVWTAKVTHTTNPTKLNISKSATLEGSTAVPEAGKALVVKGGNSAVFTLSGFGTTEAVANMRVIDDLADVRNYMTLTKIETGSYSGISAYDLILRYSGDSSKTKTIHISTPANGQTITENLADVVSVTWEFGTVPSLTVTSAPKLTMQAKEETRGNARNRVTLNYNERQEQANAPVTVIYSGNLKKSAMKDGKPVDNTTNPLNPGDYVTFTINYKNMSDKSLTVNSANPLKDYLTTKGLEPGEITVNSYVVDEGNNRLDNTVLPKTVTITAADVSSANAKIINFTLKKPLAPGDMVVISYRVQISDAFEKSQADKNQGKDTSWGITGGQAPNLIMLHNHVTIVQDGVDLSEGTDFYYKKGEDLLYFQKSVSGFSTVSTRQRGNVGVAGDRDVADLSFWGDSRSSYNADGTHESLDYVRYMIVIANDSASGTDLAVQQIDDILPENACSYVYNTKPYTFGPLLLAPAHKQMTANGYNFQYDAVFGYTYIGPLNNFSLSTDKIAQIAKVCLNGVPDGYTLVGGKISANRVSGAANTTYRFTLTNTSGGNLVLKPGQAFVFCYGVAVDRNTNPDPAQWDNTATLKTGQDFRVTENPGFMTAKKIINGKEVIRNMADGERIAAKTYKATVTIYPPSYEVGIDKAAAGCVAGSVGKEMTWEQATTGAVKSINTLRFGDVVCWDITVKNTGNTNITNATITDDIPYPYAIITNGSTVAKEISGETIPLTGTVTTTTTSPKNGEAHQRVTISGVSLAAGKTATIRIYTRYTAADLYSINYINTAQFTLGGDVRVSSGLPVYNSDNTYLIGVKDNASVFPIADSGSSAVKSVREGSNPDNSVSGSDAVNYISIKKGGNARYTCSVRNTSDATYTNFVLIDKVPAINDTGVVNTSSSRGSTFQFYIWSNPNFVVKLNNTTLTAGTDYVISYTTAVPSTGYTVDDWKGGGTNFSTTVAPNTAKAFRLQLMDTAEFKPGAELTVEFSGGPGSSSTAGSIGWNSFGYAYTTQQVPRVYAEPAKVGIMLCWNFSFTKVAAENTSLRLSGAEFRLYRLIGSADDGLIDVNAPASNWELVSTVITDTDGLVNFQNLPAGEYRLVEAKAPAGRVRPGGQWKILLTEGTEQPQITAVGSTKPPAFISTSDGKLLLPNRQSVDFPSSGGIGTILFAVGGTILMGGGALLLASFSRRSRGKRCQ